MGENFRPIPVPENSVLSCDVGRDVVVSSVGTTFSSLLWKFHLNEIPPMPRDALEIDVTFNVDTNGILNVSARDESVYTV